MFKKSKQEQQEQQLRIQKTRIEFLEHSLSNIVNYIKKGIDDPIKEEEFLSGVRVYPWNSMPVIGGEVTNKFIDLTKDMDDVEEITLMFEQKYREILRNYFYNITEFPKKSLNDIRYVITAMELVNDESNPNNNGMLKVTFAKIENMKKTVDVRAKDGSYQSTYIEE